jgi:hypothetical protein
VRTEKRANGYRQAWIREKAVTDASRMNLRPLAPVADDTRPKFAFYPFASASLTNIRTPREIPSAHYHTLQRHKSYDNVLEKTPHRSVFNGDEYSFHSPRGDALLRKISDGLLSSRTSSTQALSPTAYASQPSLPYRNHSFADLPPDVRKNSWRGSRFGDDELGMEDGMGWRGIFGRA